MSLIEVKDLYKIYNPGENEVRALDGVTLQMERGDFIAIIGQSGSGKSTLMNMLGLLDVPTSGEYYLDGEDVAHMTDDQLSEIRNKQIGFIFQGFNLISSLTAQGNVELPLAYRGMPKEERHKLSLEALERVGLGHRLDHLPKQMSGGQQQRVGIARAFVAKPDVVFADEPTGNLDSKTTIEVMEMIKSFARRFNQTIVLVTHDPEMAQYADRIITLVDGRIVKETINNNEGEQHEQAI